LRDRCRDIADAAHDLRRVVRGAQAAILEDAVLERDDRRFEPDQRTDLLQRRLGVPELDAEHHEVDDPHLCRIVGRADAGDVHRIRALDAQARAAHRLQMRAASDEAHVRAARREARTEVAADAARAHDRDSHRLASEARA